MFFFLHSIIPKQRCTVLGVLGRVVLSVRASHLRHGHPLKLLHVIHVGLLTLEPVQRDESVSGVRRQRRPQRSTLLTRSCSAVGEGRGCVTGASETRSSVGGRCCRRTSPGRTCGGRFPARTGSRKQKQNWMIWTKYGRKRVIGEHIDSSRPSPNVP